MKRLFMLIVIVWLLAIPVYGEEYVAPDPPDGALELMPAQRESFGDGLREVLTGALQQFQPKLAQGMKACAQLIAVTMLVSLLRHFSENSRRLTELVAAVGVGVVLLSQSDSLIHLGTETVAQLSDYGKLLLPVMTGALTAQGGITSSAALYTGTMLFDAFLSSSIAFILTPLVYAYLALAIAHSALGEEMLGKLRDFAKWLMTWFLKITLYVFTGYITVTGVISGTADAAALKATKLTISGMVPVIGGILSDASEAVLVGAGIMKSAVGVYGLLAVIAIWITPFLQIGAQYLLLKLTAAICATFGVKKASALIEDFSKAMGILLAMTGAVCLMLLISTVCFMKGVGA